MCKQQCRSVHDHPRLHRVTTISRRVERTHTCQEGMSFCAMHRWAASTSHTSSCSWQQQQQQHRHARGSCRVSIRQQPVHIVQNLFSFPAFAADASSSLPSMQEVPHCTTRLAAASATAAASTGSAGVADPCLELDGLKSRSAGCLLGAMCGNALGAQVQPEKVCTDPAKLR